MAVFQQSQMGVSMDWGSFKGFRAPLKGFWGWYQAGLGLLWLFLELGFLLMGVLTIRALLFGVSVGANSHIFAHILLSHV